MSNPNGNQLAETINRKIQALKEVCEGVDETAAIRAPEGRWSPKEILSHLLGPEGSGPLLLLKTFLEWEAPRIDIETEKPFFSEQRARMGFMELLAEVEREYGRIAEFAAGLSQEQLERRAHVPAFKDSPLGEHPTLGAMIGGLADYHLQFHTDHMREILQLLGPPGQEGMPFCTSAPSAEHARGSDEDEPCYDYREGQ